MQTKKNKKCSLTRIFSANKNTNLLLCVEIRAKRSNDRFGLKSHTWNQSLNGKSQGRVLWAMIVFSLGVVEISQIIHSKHISA